MFRCLSHRAALCISLGAVLFCLQGCQKQQWHLVCYTDPPTCKQCREDEARLEELAEQIDIRYPDPDKSPDGKIPYYKLYAPDGRLVYSGHDISEVHP